MFKISNFSYDCQIIALHKWQFGQSYGSHPIRARSAGLVERGGRLRHVGTSSQLANIFGAQRQKTRGYNALKAPKLVGPLSVWVGSAGG